MNTNLTVKSHFNGQAEGSIYEGEASVIDNTQPLQAGHYWKAIAKMPAPEPIYYPGDNSWETSESVRARRSHSSSNYEIGETLLLQKIDWVDNKAHTVYILCHPSRQGSSCSSSFKMLVNDFLACFTPNPDGDLVRNQELADAQMNVGKLQQDFIQLQSNPSAFHNEVVKSMDLKALPQMEATEMNSVSSGIDLIVNGGDIELLKSNAQAQVALATATSDFIVKRTEAINKAVQAMTPYFHEKAAVALARVGDVKAGVEKLMKGIESLDLYTGKNVTVEAIISGKESAPASEPLTLFQRKLFMDEEICVHVDIDEIFDYKSVNQFFSLIKTDNTFRDRILPASRCIVMIQVTAKAKLYSDNALVNYQLNRNNLSAFMLARDGENIHAIYSPIESHEAAQTLFPMASETDNVFKGIDGKAISFNDLSYTDKLSKHESMALHYKRFLILLAGLDHRLDLFGKFYEGGKSLDFISIEFQNEHMRFVNDAESNMLNNGERLDPVEDYIYKLNKKIQSGSRIALYSADLITHERVPALNRNYGLRPTDPYSVSQAYGHDGNVVVDLDMIKWNSGDHMNCKVTLFKEDKFTNPEGVLCMDFADVNKLRRYVNERQHRINFPKYINLFKFAIRHIEAELEEQKITREFMRKSLIDAGYAPDALNDIITSTILSWRAMNRGIKLPEITEANMKQHKAILDQLFFQANLGEATINAIKNAAEEAGREVLRISLKPNAKWVVYVAPVKEEILGFPIHPWVKKLNVNTSKSGIKLEPAARYELLRDSIKEKVMFESESAAEWLKKQDPDLSRDLFSDLVKSVYQFNETINNVFMNPTEATLNKFISIYSGIKREIGDPRFYVPFSIYQDRYGKVKVMYLTGDAGLLLGYMAGKFGTAKKDDVYENIYRSRNKWRRDSKKEFMAINSDEAMLSKNQKLLGICVGDRHPINELGLVLGSVTCDSYKNIHGLDCSLEKAVEAFIKKQADRKESNYSDAITWIDGARYDGLDKLFGIKSSDVSQTVMIHTRIFSSDNFNDIPGSHKSKWIVFEQCRIDQNRYSEGHGSYDFLDRHLNAFSSKISKELNVGGYSMYGGGSFHEGELFPKIDKDIFDNMSDAIAYAKAQYPNLKLIQINDWCMAGTLDPSEILTNRITGWLPEN